MRLVIVLTVLGCTFAAKLDRTYLPTSGAALSGGSPGSLNTPFGSQGPSSSGFGQAPTSFGVNGNKGPFAQPQTLNQKKQQGFSPSGQGSFGQNVELSASNDFAPEQGFEMSQQPERLQAGADRSAEILRFTNENDGETFNYSFETSNGITAEETGVATNGVQALGSFSYIGDDGQTYSVTYTADENGYQPRGDHLPTPPPIPDVILRSIEKNAAAAAAGTQEGAYQEDYNESEQYNVPDQQYDIQQYSSPTPHAEQRTGNFQQYETPASSGLTRSNVANGFSPSAPNGFIPSAAESGTSRFTTSRPALSNFAPSGLASSGLSSSGPAIPGQFVNRPQTPASRQTIPGVSQQQDASGYRYNPAPLPEFRGNSNAILNKEGSLGAQGIIPSNFAGTIANAAPEKPYAGQTQASYRTPQKAVPQGSFTSTRPPNGRPSASKNFNNQPAEYSSNNDAQSSRASQTYQRKPAAVKTAMTEYQSAPYQYNPPMSRGQQNLSSGPSGATQKFTQKNPSGLNNPRASQKVEQDQGQIFGAPRQPPSFSSEEGYKY